MPVFLVNPAGLLALIGVPILVAIYFFQRRSKEFMAPTLFLLRHQAEHRTGGSKFKRFQPSWPFFLQVLSVILLALLLAQPRVRSVSDTQKIAIVIDSSASMSAFESEMLSEVERLLIEAGKDVSALSIQLFESAPESPVLYAGESSVDGIRVLKEWQPLTGTVDPTAVLNVARSRVGAKGLVIYVSDHIPDGELPARAHFTSVGSPINNVGFCGVSTRKRGGETYAQVLVKNYGGDKVERPYQLQLATGEVVLERVVSLLPQQVKTLSFPLTAERSAVCFILAADAFSLDDVAPVVLPQKKLISLCVKGGEEGLQDVGNRLLRISDTSPSLTEKGADVIIQSVPVNGLMLPAAHSISFIKSPPTLKSVVNTERIIPSGAPLAKDLLWESLIIRETSPFTSSSKDEVLLWVGKQPLVSLRYTTDGEDTFQHLLCHFSLKGSNLETQANMAILLFRFIEQVREEKQAFFQEQAEVSQPIQEISLLSPLSEDAPLLLQGELHYASSYKRTVSDPRELRSLSLPAEPNIIRISQRGKPLMVLASHFADTREADFTSARSAPLEVLSTESERIKSTKPFPYSFLILLLLLGLSLGVWALQGRKSLNHLTTSASSV